MLTGTQATRFACSVLALTLAFGAMSCSAGVEPLPPFKDGIVDMKMFDTGTPVMLDGAWEFYWNRFIDPKSFFDGGQPLPDALATFPAVWNDYGLEGIGQTGYATWRLSLTGLASGQAYGLKASSFISAVAIHVNGELVQSHGWPGRSAPDEAPGWDSNVTPVSANQDGIVDIVVHVSNWADGSGGTRARMVFGDLDKVVAHHRRAMAYDVFIAGVMLALGVACLGVFAVRRASAAAFWFFLMSAVLAFYTLCQGEYFIMSLFPGMEWRLLFDLRHLCIALAIVFCAAIIREALPGEFPGPVVLALVLVSVVYASAVIWVPTRQVALVFPWYQALALLAGLGAIVSSVIAMVHRRSGAWIFACMTVSSFAVFSHDALVYNGYIGGYILTGNALPLLLFGISLALARGLAGSNEASGTAEAELAHGDPQAEQRGVERLVPSEILPLFKRERLGDVVLGDAASRKMAIVTVTILESSRMPELSTPAAIFAFINEFMDRVTPAVAAADGFVYRYEGYVFSVLFHNGAEAALRCALDIQSRIAVYNTERENRGRKLVRIAMGLHSGELVLGTVGGSRRMDVSVVSTDFELGTRLMNLAVDYDLGIAASDRFMSELGESSSCRMRMVGKTRGSEKSKPVTVFEIYDDDAEERGSRKDATRAVFEQAVEAWHARRLNQARTLFNEVLSKVPGDGASLKYLSLLTSRLPERDVSKPRS